MLGLVWVINHSAVFLIGAGIALGSLLLSQLIQICRNLDRNPDLIDSMPPRASRACTEVTGSGRVAPGPCVGMPDESATGTMAAILVKLDRAETTFRSTTLCAVLSKMNISPIVKHLVLIGGGFSHLAVLRQLGIIHCPALAVTLITRGRDPVLGSLPAHLIGHYNRDLMHIDLRPLAQFAGALDSVEVTEINLNDRNVSSVIGRYSLRLSVTEHRLTP